MVDRSTMPSLVFLAGPIAGRRFPLAEGEYVIGRRSDCQVFVPDMRVSRQHARVRRAAEGWLLEDLGSNNGTFVNGVRVARATSISPDDVIVIANNRIRVEDHELTPDPVSSLRVTIVDVDAGEHPLITSRQDPGSDLPAGSGMPDGLAADRRAIRLIERKLDALTQVLRATAASDTDEALLQKLVEALLEMFPQADHVGVLTEEERTGELRVQCQVQRTPRGTAARSETPLQVPRTILDHAIRDDRGVLLRSSEPADGEHTGRRMGAPLVHHDARYGVVYVESHGPGFCQDDVDLLHAIAKHVGLAMHALRVASQLSRREQLERDLRVARQIQRSLLPASVPDVPGLDFAVHYEPAYQVGGDFYDFIWHDRSRLAVAVGDVAGKAISAALYMARLTSELRSRAAIAGTPSQLLRRVNRAIARLGDDGMFATLVYCIYDLEHRSLVFTNAGHCLPLLRRGDQVFPLEAERAHTPPLGVTPELDAAEARVQLSPGDLLLLVSDGILEARDAHGDEYGLSRLSSCLRGTTGTSDQVIQAILADVGAHTGPQAQGDDMTIVAMRIEERAGSPGPR